ncbi:MAG TPA: NADP(H)-dependent aldo-keto reductase [Kiloniellales bacterium]|jgi:aryl-alcohol dehydrogenase-like predicted oxidoreductase|nr:NADP(H)-dependent aldo-keto reductase [Kiloniellales bacterium]
MELRRLGRTDLDVSLVCLGTMTWGRQNTLEDGLAQMDYALDRGIFFWDTAEMYPIAPTAETYGRTEEIIGEWFASRGGRDRIVLATKAVGPGDRFRHVRDGYPKFNRTHLIQAVDDSLRRLKTDYIDLYQLHWPERNVNTFGKLGYRPSADEPEWTPLEEVLSVLADIVQSGKIRHIGVSNETPWGVMKFLQLADQGIGPRLVSIQNPYSLLNRTFEVGLAEIAHREKVGLLAYAPIAAGALSGKYLDGQRPAGARMTVFPDNKRYFTPQGEEAVRRYVSLARDHGLDPAQMAHAFVLSRPFLTSSIVGATTLEQLKTAIDSLSITLSADVLEEIEKIHHQFTYPCP